MGAQAVDGEPFLERRPAEALRIVGPPRGIQRVEVDAFPIGIGAVPAQAVQVFLRPAAPAPLPGRAGLESGDGLLGPARVEEPPPDRRRRGRALPLLARHEGDVGVHVPFAVGEVLQGPPHGRGPGIVAVRRRTLRQGGGQLGPERRDAGLAQRRENDRD